MKLFLICQCLRRNESKELCKKLASQIGVTFDEKSPLLEIVFLEFLLHVESDLLLYLIHSSLQIMDLDDYDIWFSPIFDRIYADHGDDKSRETNRERRLEKGFVYIFELLLSEKLDCSHP